MVNQTVTNVLDGKELKTIVSAGFYTPLRGSRIIAFFQPRRSLHIGNSNLLKIGSRSRRDTFLGT